MFLLALASIAPPAFFIFYITIAEYSYTIDNCNFFTFVYSLVRNQSTLFSDSKPHILSVTDIINLFSHHYKPLQFSPIIYYAFVPTLLYFIAVKIFVFTIFFLMLLDISDADPFFFRYAYLSYSSSAA